MNPLARCILGGVIVLTPPLVPTTTHPATDVRLDDTCNVMWGNPAKHDDGFWYVAFSNGCPDAHTGWCDVRHTDGTKNRYAAWIPGGQSADVSLGMLQDGDKVDCGAD